MADKQISDLTSASAMTDGSLFVLEQAGAAMKANWGMMKNYISPGVAAQYSTSATYDVGDYVIYNGQLYRCTTAITTAESWTAAHWMAAVLGDDVGDLKNALDYSNDHLGSYKYGLLDKPYEKRFIGLLKTGYILDYDDEYTSSSRAFFKIEDAYIDGDVYIYNPKAYTIGIYKRRKSDNYYSGYAVNSSNNLFFKFTPDTSNYDYWLLAIHYTNGTETNWTYADLDDANRNIYVYSGDYINYRDTLSLQFSPNLITQDIIHIGKYYYGDATPATNPDMAYTDLIPIKENHTYYFPYLTIGYSWYAEDGVTVIGGDYAAVETVAQRPVFITLTAPTGAAFIGVSVRSGDAPNMVLSELADSKAPVEQISSLPVVKSHVVREPLNWLYNMDFKRTMGGSRLSVENGGTFDGEKVVLGSGQSITCRDQVTMDKSKVVIEFAVQNNVMPSFLLGINGYYANTSLSIEDGALCVWFRSDGTARVQMGTGQSGAYATYITDFDISGLNISSGRRFVFIFEKDTINKYIISVYDALTPNNVASVTIQATQNPQDANLYTGGCRGWGGPYALCNSGGNIEIYRVQMYSTAPTYPHVAIWGDSYVENMGRNPACSYAYLLRDALDGDALLSGQGGATATQTSYRLAKEINACAPQYVILNVGVNDSFNVSVDTYKTALLRLIEMVKEKGAVPILVTVPNVPAGNSTTRAFCETANPWVRSLGYDYIDIAYALSTGDGITGDSSKFVSDATHPNLAGGQAIFNYIKAFLPYLLWK